MWGCCLEGAGGGDEVDTHTVCSYHATIDARMRPFLF